MMKNLRIAAALIALLVAIPGFAQRGSADFTHFVALGDSYGAGVSNGSLNDRHQQYSWPAIIARQAGVGAFAQSWVSYPGIGPELVLTDIVSYPPRLVPASGQGAPYNTSYPAPYNNLSVPGAGVQHMTSLTGAEQNPVGTAQQTARFILRGLGTPVQQAVAQHPTFIAVWIGGNDLLGAVLSGNPAALTPLETFRTAYNAMLDQLVAGAPNAGMVVGNLPTTQLLPVLTTAQPVIINPATRQPLLINGQPVFLIYDDNGTVKQLPPGSRVLLTSASKLGTGYGIPPTLAAVPPFNALPDAGKPLSGSDVLVPTELQQIEAWAIGFNEVIQQAATARNIPVANIKGLFDRFTAANGYRVGPFTFNASYLTGGIFSYDGFHLTDIGYLFFANEYIRTINAAYHTDIPLASLTQFFQNNQITATTESGAPVYEGMLWTMTEEAENAIREYATPVPSRRRLRAAN